MNSSNYKSQTKDLENLPSVEQASSSSASPSFWSRTKANMKLLAVSLLISSALASAVGPQLYRRPGLRRGGDTNIHTTTTTTRASITTTTKKSTTTTNQTSSVTASGSAALGPSAYAASYDFPSSVWTAYYSSPTGQEPQPKVYDPVLKSTYAESLTNPLTIPVNNTVDPIILPSSLLLGTEASGSKGEALASVVVELIKGIVDSANFNNTCSKCLAGLSIGQMLALTAPDQVPGVMVELCEYYDFSSTCSNTYSASTYGSVITQVLAFANVSGYDGQSICTNFISSSCKLPPASPLNLTFPKPKPSTVAKVPTGENRKKVLHLSDLHLDPRYDVGSEADCASGLCCRATNSTSITLEAPRFGYFKCDSPYALALAGLEAIPVLTGTKGSGFDFALFTGDLVSHDAENELSIAYIEYTETVLYTLFKNLLGSGPVYAAIGNHDSYQQAQDAIQSLTPEELADAYSWNYDHLAALWELDGWITEAQAAVAKAHYGAYSVARPDGLTVITLNTDLWYKSNYFAYINMSTSDPSGMLTFLIQELQQAEDDGQAVYIIGHVLPGWDGSNPLVNPTNMFYQIVDRYSATIKGTFWGHTHEDFFSIFYANNATVISEDTAQNVMWVGPSMTPLTNLNSGFRMYEVDGETWDVLDAYTWFSNVSTFSELDELKTVGPTYEFEYSHRDVYGQYIDWPDNAPLNATWFHKLTEVFESNATLVNQFRHFQGKSSVITTDCTGDCPEAIICYMRSASAAIAKDNCITGYGSVQSD